MKMWLDWLLWLPIVLWPLLEMARQIAAWRALRAMPSPPVNDDDARFMGVDVLQPIRSGDPTLAEALGASLRTLGARGAMLHWLIDIDDLAAARIVRSVVDAQPALRAQVATSAHPPCPPGINPKLFKIDRALAHCTGDAVLVLDDDARMPAATLDALLAALAGSRIDAPVISTALPIYLRSEPSLQRLGARLLARFVNDSAAITYLPPRLGGRTPTINGMAWAMRRDALDAIGGFAARLRHLTDDLAMAQAVLAAGGRIDQRREPVWMRTALPDLRAYARQMHRWMLFARLLLRSQPWPMRLRIAAGQGLSALLPTIALIAFAMAPSWPAAAVIAIGAIAHLYGRRALQRACTGSAARIEPVASLLVALLLPLHLLHALFDTRVCWREHHYRVFANDRFEEIP
ncbi:MAG: glycosyltransferase [Lysobacter sp.]|nr:glycosyltransferase [Lysobacter sp.]